MNDPSHLVLPPRPGHARDAPVLLGYSGGLDSRVLLDLLARDAGMRARGLRAVHVHHGLHADADAWAAHCRATCERLGVSLEVVRVDVDPGAGEGPEAAARAARHGAFADALATGEVLALAHHRDDQAETFLLRALRGSGVDGLAAMRPWRGFARGWLWRPLLDLPRARLLAHAQRAGLDWIEDPSNDDASLDRNFLRHRVLPLLGERWPEAGRALARSAGLCGEARELLDGEDARALAAAMDAGGAVDIAALLALPPARRARVLRRWVADTGLPPLPARGLAAIEADLLDAPADGSARFAWSGAVVRAWGGRLHAAWQDPGFPADWQVAWTGTAPLVLPDGGVLRLAPLDATAPAPAHGFERPLAVRARRGGERIRLPGRTHSHALKHVLQERGVPPWLRGRMPLLFDPDGTLLAAGGIASDALGAWLREHGLRLEHRAPAP